jgi:hypothetical protein
MIPDKFTFVQVIKACYGLGTLGGGRLVHEQLIQSGCESDVFVGSSLVDKYAKSGSIEDVSRVFNNMPYSQDVVTWDSHHIGTCAIQARAEGTGTILTNATGGCATKLCSFCGGAECMCQHGCG